MVNDTLKYQKQYGFDIGENNSAHNNEADAFRHTYMQSFLNEKYGKFKTEGLSLLHEIKGNIFGQDPREANMDMWNNLQGQQIYNEIRKEYPNFGSMSQEQQKDIVAKKVVEKMHAGDLITDINDKRKFKNPKIFNPPFFPTRGVGRVPNNGIPTGYASNINNNEWAKQLGFQSFDIQIPQQKPADTNKIFTREEIGDMTTDQFEKNEKAIMNQLKTRGIPSKRDLPQGYKNSENYNSKDGHWVTINGNHVLLKN